MPGRTPKSYSADARKLCRSVIDAVNESILIHEPRTFRILDVNKCAIAVYGYSRKEFIGKALTDITNQPPVRSEVDCGRAVERTDLGKGGREIPFLVSLCTIDYWGRKAILSINHDISERKHIEAALAASEKKMRSLVEGISEIVVLIDAKGLITFISPQVESVLGYPVARLKEKNVFDFVHPDDRERAMGEYQQTVKAPGQGVPSTLRLTNDSGQWIPFEIIANNQLADSDVNAVIFTARDLRYRHEAARAVREANADFEKRVEGRTMEMAKANAALRIENQQRRYTESQLQQSLSLLNATLESTADGILVISNARLISSCNQRFMQMWNIPKMAVTGLKDEALLAIASPQLQDPVAFQEGVAHLYSHPDAVDLDTIHLKDGRIFERYSQPQRVGDQIVGRVWSFRDVTHSRQMEDELRQAQKMEAVGRLAGGVAHDFNNMLMLISGYASQLLDDTNLPKRHQAITQQLVEATRRAATLTRQLLAFSRKQAVVPRLMDVNEVVTAMEKMLRRLLSDRVHLMVHLYPGQLSVQADPSQIELVLMNLAINARDAMQEGGVLSLRTSLQAVSEMSTGKQAERRFAVLEVSDTGHGMSPEIKKHIFEPFFTTKEAGRGTGLGLSTVYGIVEGASGHVSVESEPGQGATFRIYLPSVSQKVVHKPKQHDDGPRSGDETILLVEDEAGIRAMTKMYLETLGYNVLEAASASEAEKISHAHSGEIHLVVTDIVMPGRRGDAMVRSIQGERPDIRAIFMSGYADRNGLDPDVPVLEKPFAFPDLGRCVRDVLDRPTPKARARKRA